VRLLLVDGKNKRLDCCYLADGAERRNNGIQLAKIVLLEALTTVSACLFFFVAVRATCFTARSAIQSAPKK